MGWIGQEILRQMAGHVGEQIRPLGRPVKLVFRIENGLILGVTNMWDSWVYFDYSLLGSADGSVLMPPLRDAIKFRKKIRGYSRVPLADSRKPLNVLPPEILARLDQVAEGLSRPSWGLWMHECMSPILRVQGFPERRFTCNYSAFLPAHVIRRPDYAGYARLILGQTGAMRSLLEDVLKLRPAAKLEPS